MGHMIDRRRCYTHQSRSCLDNNFHLCYNPEFDSKKENKALEARLDRVSRAFRFVKKCCEISHSTNNIQKVSVG